MRISTPSARLLVIAYCVAAVGLCCAQEVTVSGRVVLEGGADASSSTVVWLAPTGTAAGSTPTASLHAVLTQKNKTFDPHLIVITRGSTVEFPNRDPWFHNVFSLFNGKRFDLGLYEAGTSRTVHFDREGVSFIFCNIHPEMSAIIVVVATPYFAVTSKQGEFSIPNVLPGHYSLHLWNQSALPATLQALSHEVQVSDTSRTVGTIQVAVTKSTLAPHKNKYGQDYEPPSPNNPVYVQP